MGVIPAPAIVPMMLATPTMSHLFRPMIEGILVPISIRITFPITFILIVLPRETVMPRTVSMLFLLPVFFSPPLRGRSVTVIAKMMALMFAAVLGPLIGHRAVVAQN